MVDSLCHGATNIRNCLGDHPWQKPTVHRFTVLGWPPKNNFRGPSIYAKHPKSKPTIIMDHHGSSWIIMDHHGSSWIIMDHGSCMKFSPSPSSSHFLVCCDSGRSVLTSLAGESSESSDLDIQNPPAPKVLGRDRPDGTRKRLQVYLGGGAFFGQNLLFLIGRDARLQKTL